MSAWFQDRKLHDALELVQKLIVVFGVPIAIWNYTDERAKEREAREWTAYEKMDDRYWTYERLAMDFPRLNVSDAEASDSALAALTVERSKLTPEDRLHERQLMFMLIAMYERAFLLYRDETTEFRTKQWSGWNEGLKRWTRAPGFLAAWRVLGGDFDESYQAYVNDLIEQMRASPEAATTASGTSLGR